MVNVRDVSFRRMGYSGNEKFAEVEVRLDGFNEPLVVTFKQDVLGELSLVSVTGIEADHDLDWYENNLHAAFPKMESRLFGSSGGEEARRNFAADVLSFNDTEEMLKDKFYYGE